MVHLSNVGFVAALLASASQAMPKHGHHHHHSSRFPGTATSVNPYPTAGPTDAPFPIGNSSTIYPTGTAPLSTGVSSPSVILITQTVVPLPASSGSSSPDTPSNPAAPIQPGKLEVSHGSPGPSDSPSPSDCSGAVGTVTVTTQNTVTVTITPGAGPVESSSAAPIATSPVPSAPYPVDNSTAPIFPTSVGASSTAAPVATSTEASSSSSDSYPSSSPEVTPTAGASSTAAPAFSSSYSMAPVPSTSASPVSSSYSSTPTTKPTSGGSPSGAKRGLVYNDAGLADYFANQSSISWAYNWASSPGELASCFNFVPMLWGSDAGDFASAMNKAIGSGSKELMAFNEPDMAKQYGGSDIDPGTAAQLYQKNVMPFAGKVRLGAPAITNGNKQSPPMGLPWLQQFVGSCKGCQVDFVPFHWYGWNDGTADQQADNLKEYVAKVASTVEQIFGEKKKLWLTEFAALPMNDATKGSAFLEKVLPYLDQSDDIERYSYFMVSQGNLVDGNGPSAVGKVYMTA